MTLEGTVEAFLWFWMFRISSIAVPCLWLWLFQKCTNNMMSIYLMNLNDTVFSKAWAQQYVFNYCHGFWHISPKKRAQQYVFDASTWPRPPISPWRWSQQESLLLLENLEISKKYCSKYLTTRCRSSFLSYLVGAIQIIYTGQMRSSRSWATN